MSSDVPRAFIEAASRFQRPRDLVALLERHRGERKLSELMNDPRLKPFKEAWQASVFGIGYEHLSDKSIEVRICEPEPFPDFEARVDGVVHGFESRMVTRKRLGDAYRGDERIGPVVPVKPAKLPPFDPEPIRQAVQDKASKHYSGAVNLLLYVSFPGGNAQFSEVAKAVNESGGDKFESVWVITYDHIGCPRRSEKLARCDGWLKIPGQEPIIEGA